MHKTVVRSLPFSWFVSIPYNYCVVIANPTIKSLNQHCPLLLLLLLYAIIIMANVQAWIQSHGGWVLE